MSALISLREYADSDRDEVVQLLSEGRPPAFAFQKQTVFEWQFNRNPFARGESPFLIGEHQGRVVAALGLQPLMARSNRNLFRMAWCCDFFVAAEIRGRGVGSQLVAMASRRFPLIAAYGISDMSDPVFARQGWTPDPNLAVYFLPVAETDLRGLVKTARSRIYRRPLTTDVAVDVQVAQADSCSLDEAGELWEACAPTYGAAVERSSEYLDWKYRQHPTHRYVFFEAKRFGRLVGLLVARPDPQTSIIVDYLGPADDGATMRLLLSAATETLSKPGTVRIQCETNHRPLQRALAQSGFLKSKYSSRFRLSGGFFETTYVPGEWFLTSGDSDGDLFSREEVPH